MSTLPSALRYGSIALAAIVLLAFGIAFFPWDVMRPVAAHYLGRQFHRDVTLSALDIDLGRTTLVQMDDVTLANAPWSAEPRMAHVDRVEMSFSLPSLITGEPDLVMLRAPDVLLEKSDDGQVNWHFDDSAKPLAIGRIDVDRGTIRYRDPKVRADIAGTVETESANDDTSSLHVTARGKLKGEAFELDARGSGLVAVRREAAPYALVVKLRAGGTTVDFDGTVVPEDPENLRGTLALKGPDLSFLYPIVPAPLPWTPPYRLRGELSHGNKLWTVRGLKGVVGDSDLAGDVRIDTSRPRAMTTAELTSARFDYQDLGGFIGLPPGERSGGAHTAAQRKEEQHRAESPRALPDKSFDLTKLRDVDADVKFRGTAVKFGAVPIDNLVAHLTLLDGVLRFKPLDFGIADGHVVSNVILDATQPTATVDGEINARRVELKQIFPALASPQGTAGRFNGHAKFKTKGNSIAEMFAAASGVAAISMQGGQASTLALVLTDMDLARAVPLLLKGDETADIRCAIAAMHVNEGVLTPDLFVIDSSEELITGEGSVDFRTERYDLRLKGDSRKPSLVALRGPIVIGGTFKAPSVGPAVGPIVARVGAAAGLGAVAPPLALLPLVDLGDAPDIECRTMNEQTRALTGTTERITRAPEKGKTSAPNTAQSAAKAAGSGRGASNAVSESATKAGSEGTPSASNRPRPPS